MPVKGVLHPMKTSKLISEYIKIVRELDITTIKSCITYNLIPGILAYTYYAPKELKMQYQEPEMFVEITHISIPDNSYFYATKSTEMKILTAPADYPAAKNGILSATDMEKYDYDSLTERVDLLGLENAIEVKVEYLTHQINEIRNQIYVSKSIVIYKEVTDGYRAKLIFQPQVTGVAWDEDKHKYDLRTEKTILLTSEMNCIKNLPQANELLKGVRRVDLNKIKGIWAKPRAQAL